MSFSPKLTRQTFKYLPKSPKKRLGSNRAMLALSRARMDIKSLPASIPISMATNNNSVSLQSPFEDDTMTIISNLNDTIQSTSVSIHPSDDDLDLCDIDINVATNQPSFDSIGVGSNEQQPQSGRLFSLIANMSKMPRVKNDEKIDSKKSNSLTNHSKKPKTNTIDLMFSRCNDINNSNSKNENESKSIIPQKRKFESMEPQSNENEDNDATDFSIILLPKKNSNANNIVIENRSNIHLNTNNNVNNKNEVSKKRMRPNFKAFSTVSNQFNNKKNQIALENESKMDELPQTTQKISNNFKTGLVTNINNNKTKSIPNNKSKSSHKRSKITSKQKDEKIKEINDLNRQYKEYYYESSESCFELIKKNEENKLKKDNFRCNLCCAFPIIANKGSASSTGIGAAQLAGTTYEYAKVLTHFEGGPKNKSHEMVVKHVIALIASKIIFF